MEPQLPLLVKEVGSRVAHVFLQVVAPRILLNENTVSELSLVLAVLLLSHTLRCQRASDLVSPADERLRQLAFVTTHFVLGRRDRCRLLGYLLLLFVVGGLAHVCLKILGLLAALFDEHFLKRFLFFLRCLELLFPRLLLGVFFGRLLFFLVLVAHFNFNLLA